MSAPLSSYGMTKEQHDEIAATRNRPLTGLGSEGMNVRPRDTQPVAPDTADVIDDAMGRIGRSEVARIAARRRARQGLGKATQ